MATEIERKFLVNRQLLEAWHNSLPVPPYCIPTHIAQGYLSDSGAAVSRVRVTSKECYLTVKMNSSQDGLSCSEFEYEIPEDDALEMINGCSRKLRKIRHKVTYMGHTLEIDLFTSLPVPLIMMEVEFDSVEEANEFTPPPFVVDEVTSDRRFSNFNLSSIKTMEEMHELFI